MYMPETPVSSTRPKFSRVRPELGCFSNPGSFCGDCHVKEELPVSGAKFVVACCILMSKVHGCRDWASKDDGSRGL